LEFELASKREVVPYPSSYYIAKFGKFWSIINVVSIIYKYGSVSRKRKKSS
jgi:hypothetical protein